MKQISEETIEKLKQLIRNRNNYFDIKEVLDNLEDAPDILKDLKELLHTRVKSTILSSDIREIVNKYSKEV